MGGAITGLIPDNQLFTGKDLTVPIEQDNSNIRHFLARDHRRTEEVVSRSSKWWICRWGSYHHFHDNLDAFAKKPRFSGLSLVRKLMETLPADIASDGNRHKEG